MCLLLTETRTRCDRDINNICHAAEIHGPPRIGIIVRVRYLAWGVGFNTIYGVAGAETTRVVATVERRLAKCEVATGFNENITHTINK